MRNQHSIKIAQEGVTPLLSNSASPGSSPSLVSSHSAFCLESKHGRVCELFATRLNSKQNEADFDCCLDSKQKRVGTWSPAERLDSKQNIDASSRRPGADAKHNGEVLMMS